MGKIWGDFTSPYARKLQDPRWQMKRLVILQRDGCRCQICERTDMMLHIHHTAYVKGAEPWEGPGTALLPLCRECHQAEDDLASQAGRDLIQNMGLAGFTSVTLRVLSVVFEGLWKARFVAVRLGLEPLHLAQAIAELVLKQPEVLRRAAWDWNVRMSREESEVVDGARANRPT